MFHELAVHGCADGGCAGKLGFSNYSQEQHSIIKESTLSMEHPDTASGVPLALVIPDSADRPHAESHLNADSQYRCVVLPLTNDAFMRRCLERSTESVLYPSTEESLLPLSTPKCQIIGRISSWIRIGTHDLTTRSNHVRILTNEIRFAQSLGVDAFLLTLQSSDNADHVNISSIAKILALFPEISLTIHFHDFNNDNQYDTWNLIRTQCEYNHNLFLSLSLQKGVDYSQWYNEPIKLLFLSHDSIDDLKICISHIYQLKRLDPPFTAFVSEEEETTESGKARLVQILRDVHSKPLIPHLFISAYNNIINSGIPNEVLHSPDILQLPLEPFDTDLDNAVYQEFEKDTFKYDQYERAFIKALIDMNRKLKSDVKPHILFIGPGRGPLIDRLFSAFKTLSLSASSYTISAIERNTSIMPILHQKNTTSWNGLVNLECMDSSVYPQSKHHEMFGTVHMVVSELIGSFGCNELMPECIDSIASADVCSQNCIFIPSSVTSYINPISAPKLWKYATEKDTTYPMEKLYVSIVPEMRTILEKPLDVWSFESKTTNESDKPVNKRSNITRSSINTHSEIHGLAGYFSAILYPGVKIDNIPVTGNSNCCVSWLPAFFPFETPIHVNRSQNLEIFITRECMDDDIWYEWSATVSNNDEDIGSVITKIHNLNGRGFKFKRVR